MGGSAVLKRDIQKGFSRCSCHGRPTMRASAAAWVNSCPPRVVILELAFMEFFYAMVVSWFAADHGKNTRSIMTTIWNNTTPITDSRIKEPNATGVLKNAVAVMII